MRMGTLYSVDNSNFPLGGYKNIKNRDATPISYFDYSSMMSLMRMFVLNSPRFAYGYYIIDDIKKLQTIHAKLLISNPNNHNLDVLVAFIQIVLKNQDPNKTIIFNI